MNIHDQADKAQGSIEDFKADTDKAFNTLLSTLGTLCKNADFHTGTAMEELRGYLVDIKSDFIFTATVRAQETADSLSESAYQQYTRENASW